MDKIGKRSKHRFEEGVQEEFLFEIGVWKRYFDMRRSFFSMLFKLHTFCVVVLIIGAFAAITSKSIVLTAVLLAIILGVYIQNLLVTRYDMLLNGFAGATAYHNQMFHQLYDIEILVYEGQHGLAQKQKDDTLSYDVIPSEIYRVVWAIAFNQECVARGLPEKYHLTVWQKRMANVLPMREKGLVLNPEMAQATPDIACP